MTSIEPVGVFQIVVGAITIFNCGELLAMIFYRFKSYRSVYFKSLVASTVGTVAFVFGYLMLYFGAFANMAPSLLVITIGWHCMVTGFSMTMYSRLHLFCVDTTLISICLKLITVTYVFLQLPTTVLIWGANMIGSRVWIQAYGAFEGFQVTVFFIQETILCTIYLLYVSKNPFKIEKSVAKELTHQTFKVNVFIIALDLIMVGVEYAQMLDYQIMVKALCYSLKLKLAYHMMNHLTDTFQAKFKAEKESFDKTVYKDEYSSEIRKNNLNYPKKRETNSTASAGSNSNDPVSIYEKSKRDTLIMVRDERKNESPRYSTNSYSSPKDPHKQFAAEYTIDSLRPSVSNETPRPRMTGFEYGKEKESKLDQLKSDPALQKEKQADSYSNSPRVSRSNLAQSDIFSSPKLGRANKLRESESGLKKSGSHGSLNLPDDRQNPFEDLLPADVQNPLKSKSTLTKFGSLSSLKGASSKKKDG
ncbi:hypothetical protein HK103_006973 [Boothiomyces macroporosus]|uniref:DUF7703 domain-containing protein n=1 Tax=Boothiomyces macroporosus TaxID=261099 RepID=A0AAD5ULQ6_9FUNG|nr:hypothetical protein HK103_006973 [Boothiomyces macroporosus]